MDTKKIMIIVAALVVALGAAFGVHTLMRGSAAAEAEAAAAPKTGPKILVATRALPVGTILRPEMLRYQAWPQELVNPESYHLEGQTDQAALDGSVVRVAITAGQPLTKGNLVNPKDRGFLAAALAPGMRAITVPMSGPSGVAGFVFPGDRVDLLLTQKIDADSQEIKSTETIVHNLRVLAVDQRTNPTDEAGNSVPQVFASVTIEATPRIAEKISVAQKMGDLSLALRSIADNAADLEEALASGDINAPKKGDATTEERMLRAAASRPSDRGVTGVTAGDVSRFGNVRGRSSGRSNNELGGGSPQQAAAAAVQAIVAARAATQSNTANVYTGPTVRVTRGNTVTEVSVGGN